MSSKEIAYCQYKTYLNSLNLTSNEYQRKIKDWCKKHKF